MVGFVPTAKRENNEASPTLLMSPGSSSACSAHKICNSDYIKPGKICSTVGKNNNSLLVNCKLGKKTGVSFSSCIVQANYSYSPREWNKYPEVKHDS